MSKQTKTDDLCEIIINAIIEEPYFNKEILAPKIRTLISMFRMSVSSINYNKVLDEKGTARLIRANELQNLEKNFWSDRVKDLVGKDNMRNYYDLLDVERKKWNS